MIAGFSRPDYTGGQGAELTSATSPGQVAYGPPVHFIIDKARPKAYLIELSKRTVQSVSRSSLDSYVSDARDNFCKISSELSGRSRDPRCFSLEAFSDVLGYASR